MTDTAQFKSGDRVYVIDEGLARLREVMRRAAGQEPAPNHHGTVAEVWDDEVLINFDDGGVEGAGNAAPYPFEDVRPLTASA